VAIFHFVFTVRIGIRHLSNTKRKIASRNKLLTFK
jgi:hypothetical protein